MCFIIMSARISEAISVNVNNLELMKSQGETDHIHWEINCTLCFTAHTRKMSLIWGMFYKCLE